MIAALNNRIVYMICAPLLTLFGAATTIIAPMLLNATSFTRFALLSSVFVYLAEFDLGLARLSDRLLPSLTANDATDLVGSLLFARYCIAVILLLFVVVLGIVSDPLMLTAGIAGIGFLLGNGPLSYYRARSDTAAFAFAGLLMQFGMTLPRLVGLLIDGVAGCMLGLGLWAGFSCVVLNAPLLPAVRFRFEALALIPRAMPLFIYSAAFFLYMFANRWFSWWISDNEDAGLFAFGANLTVVATGLMMMLSQPFYPRHLTKPDPSALAQELYILLVIGTVGCGLANLFCRYALGLVFPHFGAAASTTAALLVVAVPLCLSAWLVQLVIARSNPLEVLIFPVCILLMYGLMVGLNGRAGINGQAWACLPPALLMFVAQLVTLARKELLSFRDGVLISLACLVAVSLGLLTWFVTFQ